MNILNAIKTKLSGRKFVQQLIASRELAEQKNNGASNTYVSAKERDRRKNRKKIAKVSRRRNRK